ncbi:S-layer homology domain-containing protein [Bacillus anthracis]|uniref:S-layer homology domain-containing protein n=1 Tax=Bacillus anthracis TaxID=1392 RepID=UPI00396F4AD7
MKKLVKIATSLTLMGGIFISANGVSANTDVVQKSSPDIMIKFDDVTTDHWAYDEITNLVYHRIMYGYGNGKFGVGDNVTREQVAAVLYRTLNLKKEGPLKNPYKDISERATFFLDEILVLTKHGIFEGDEKGNFRPAAPVTRAEMAQVLTRAFGLQVQGLAGFKDVPKGHWAENAINAVGSNGISVGDGNGNFAPNMKVTREQYAQFLFRAL